MAFYSYYFNIKYNIYCLYLFYIIKVMYLKKKVYKNPRPPNNRGNKQLPILLYGKYDTSAVMAIDMMVRSHSLGKF